ncbi:MAG: hypothetical protein A2328_03410, partial [Bdellovibrionales bacterium RIFOXYB2_FULL_36_6]
MKYFSKKRNTGIGKEKRYNSFTSKHEGIFMNTKNLQNWLEDVLTKHSSVRRENLEHLKSLVKKLALNLLPCPIITVAGTNGKGSCVKLLANAYREAGYQVGDYTSPHLLKFNERICINGKPVSDREIISAFEVIEKERAKSKTALTFFEFITLAALYLFKQYDLDILILEAGLGGRLDPVNLMDADLVLLTTIGLDHLDCLGPDCESIAKEKSALFRKNRLAVCGEINPPNIILETASQVGADIYFIHRDFEYAFSDKAWHWQREKGEVIEYHQLPMPKVKLQNAAMVLMVLDLLQKRLPVSKEAIVRALKKTKLPGRFEKIDHCIFDVAHNAQAAQWLVEQLERTKREGKLLCVFSILKEKDIQGIVKLLKPFVHEWYVASLESERALPAKKIAETLDKLDVKKVFIFDTVESSFLAAKKHCSRKDLILIFGSFYLVS